MADKLTISEADAEVKVTITDPDGDTPNLFVWEKGKMIAKIWLYPDGRITYRSFVPKTTLEILLSGGINMTSEIDG